MRKYSKITLLFLILFIGLFMSKRVNAAEATKSAKVTYGTVTDGEVPVTLTFSQDLKDGDLGDGWTISGKTATKKMDPGSVYMCVIVFDDDSTEEARVAVPIELKVGEILDMSSIGSEPKNFSVEDPTIATVSGTKITASKAGKTTLKGTVGLTPDYAGNLSGTQVITDFDFVWNLTVVTDSNKDTDENSDWTNFSNAEYSIVQHEDNPSIEIKISNVTSKSSHNYKYLITDSTTEPIQSNSSLSNLNYITADKTFTTQSDIGKYIALNKDMYLWVYDIYKNDSKLVVDGVKIEKPKFPKYIEAFSGCMVNSISSMVTFNFPIGDIKDQNRKINVKIGKISDNKILQKIYKKDSSGLSDLLNYAKTSNLVYDNTLTANNFRGYTTNGLLPNLDLNKFAGGEYYFLYAELDTENGKYIPLEAITLAQTRTNSSNLIPTALFFYGSDDFKWDNMDVGSALDEEIPNNTVSDKILPKTGEKAVIGIIALFALIVLAIRFKLKNKYNEIH